jgi:molybdenum cofactor biosynthesis enzyme MoaA
MGTLPARNPPLGLDALVANISDVALLHELALLSAGRLRALEGSDAVAQLAAAILLNQPAAETVELLPPREESLPEPLPSRTPWTMNEGGPEQRNERWYQNKKLAQHEYAVGTTVVTSRPVWISFDPGSICNLRCVQCARENPANASFEKHRADPKIAEKVLAAVPYLERLALYGIGEPLLLDAFWQIIEDDNTGRIPIVDINSNGTLLSEKNVERILKSSLNFLRISIDGATDATYQKIRGGKLSKVLAGVQRLTARRRELGRTDFRIWLSMTLMVENIRELPMMIDLGCDLGVDAVWAQHLIMRTDGSQDNWKTKLHGWNFVYNEQHLSNAAALSNQMVREAKKRADDRKFNFELDSNLWLPE